MTTLVPLTWLACAPEDVPGDAAPATPTADTGTPVATSPTVPEPTVPPDPVACVEDVPARFAALATEVDEARYLSARNDGVLPWPRYTDSIDNSFGLLEHFQGLQRVGNRLLVTGGVAYGERTSQLLVAEMGSRDPDGPWAPVGAPPFAPDGDGLVAAIDLDPVLWHAGGFQVADGVAAIPLAGDDPNAGEVRFYDLSDVLAPRELSPRIARPHDLYVAGIVRAADGRFVVLVWDDEVIELHRSSTTDLEDGLADASVVVTPADVDGGFQGGGCLLGCGTYQAMNLVLDCAGSLYVVATRNETKLSPTIPGDNLASLYELRWDDGSDPLMRFVDRRTFGCHDRQCNFAAAAGVSVLDGHLALYAAYHWLQDDRLLFDEFAGD